MSVPDWFRVLGLAATTAAGEPTQGAAEPGVFDTFPAHAWTVQLPGPPPQSATHTELGGPVIHGEHIFVGTANDDVLLVLHRSDGRLVRRLAAGGPVQASPVVVDGRLYFTDGGGYTWCYDAETGREIWSHYSGAPIVSSPRVDRGHVYVADVANIVVALDAATGALVWRHAQKLDPSRAVALELYGAPSPLPVDDFVVAGFSDGTLAALSAESGDVLWQRRVGEGAYPDIVGEPLAVGDTVVVAGYSEPLVAIDLGNRGFRWRIDTGGAQAAVALADNRLVVHGGVDGVLRAVDPVTGELRWTFDTKTGSALTRPVPIAAGLVVAASGGTIYLVDPDTGELRWRYEPLFHLSGVTAAPAVDGRQLVVLTNAGNLVSFVAPRPEPRWAHDAGPFARVGGRARD